MTSFQYDYIPLLMNYLREYSNYSCPWVKLFYNGWIHDFFKGRVASKKKKQQQQQYAKIFVMKKR